MIKKLILVTALTSLSNAHAQKLISSEALPQIKIPQNAKLTTLGDHKSHGIVSPTTLSVGRHKGIKLQNEVIDYLINSPANAHTRHTSVQTLITTNSNINIYKITSLVNNKTLDPTVRALALKLLTTKNKQVAVTTATKYLESKKLPLAIQALKTIIKSAPEAPATHQALIKFTKRPEAQMQQQSWPLFKGIQSEQTNQHLINTIKNLSDRSQEHLAAIEVLEVAQTFLDPKVKEALKQFKRSRSKSGPLAQWLPALHGGDAKAGELIFKNQGAAQCAKCHHYNYLTVHDGGGDAGPNLAGVGKKMNYLRTELLEAIMLPSATIAPGYGAVTVEFEKGEISGNILAYQPNGLVVQVGDDPRLISHGDYKKLRFSPSAMPPMKEKLTLRETRHVIEFLNSLTDEEGKPKVAAIKATPFDPSELKIEDPTKEIPIAEKHKQLYDINCMACHQAGGIGDESFPPLAKSEWVNGDKETLIKMQIMGLTGPIKVKGKIYDQIPMPSNARLKDEEIAGILTYIRSNWGNNASAVTAAEVAEVRKEIGDSTAPLDATTLPHPGDLTAPADSDTTETFTAQKSNSNKGMGVWGYLIILIIACIIPVAIGFFRNK